MAKYRVGVIGHTGKGNYGHGLDTVWAHLSNCEIVGVADADESGLKSAVKRLGAKQGYADYRKMLDEAKPQIVSIGPRWLDQHNCYVFTINGFPYGKFHGTRVKEKVYLPDWTSAERVDFTNRCCAMRIG